MNVIKIAPRGYCSGVISALNIVQNAAHDETLPRPIYVLGMIVHNEHITDAIDSLGVITIDDKTKTRDELLDQIESGTVIFTAHGISPLVKQKAFDKGLYVIDASCKDVIKTHVLMKDHIAEGYDVIYIGKEGHPETEGALGVDPDHIHLISKANELKNLELDNEKIIITNQTTMSLWDVYTLSEKIREKFPQATFIKEICNATQVRQEAVANQAGAAELTIVVGDPHSNNTARLSQISVERANTPSYRIADLSDLNLEWLKGVQTVAVTAGASTPTPITKEVIDFLEAYNEEDPSTWDTTTRITSDKVLLKRK